MYRYRLVLETLKPLPGDRKCFRMVNGVLVERSVGDVLPALQTNSDGLKKVLEDLLKQYQTKQTEMEKWKVSSTCEFTFALWMLMQCTEEEQYPDCSAIRELVYSVHRLPKFNGQLQICRSACAWVLEH